MIYVDSLVAWPMRAKGRGAARIFGNGKLSCHLVCDGALDELHAFAQGIGLRRAWFQGDGRLPHYDLTPGRRAAAIAAGAKECTRKELVGWMKAQPWTRGAEGAE